jgi:hypothetical protein
MAREVLNQPQHQELASRLDSPVVRDGVMGPDFSVMINVQGTPKTLLRVFLCPVGHLNCL